VSETGFVEMLARELTAAGFRGRRRARILAEFADHLECDPDAQLGDPAELARHFADELGTALARRAAFTTFAGLAVAGVLFGIGFLTAQRPLFAAQSSRNPLLLNLGAGLAVLGAQVAFVAGGLAALRSFRRRGAGAVSRQEAVVIVRRAQVGLGAGIITMVGFGLTAGAMIDHTASWWPTLALSLAGAGSLALVAAAPALFAASQVRPVAAGSAGDIYADIGPIVPRSLRESPWRFAVGVAALVAVMVAAAGVAQADPFDGALRGLLDGAACLAGFGFLGRYLGLRS
jgi:hypothetical protein